LNNVHLLFSTAGIHSWISYYGHFSLHSTLHSAVQPTPETTISKLKYDIESLTWTEKMSVVSYTL